MSSNEQQRVAGCQTNQRMQVTNHMVSTPCALPEDPAVSESTPPALPDAPVFVAKRSVDWLLEGTSVTTNRYLRRFSRAPYLRRLLAEPSCDALLRRKSKALRKELIEAYAVIEALEAHLLDGRQPAVLVDLCSGKGFLALLLACEFPSARVVAIDSDTRIRIEHFATFPNLSFVCASIMKDEFALQLEELLLTAISTSQQPAAENDHATATAYAGATTNGGGGGQGGDQVGGDQVGGGQGDGGQGGGGQGGNGQGGGATTDDDGGGRDEAAADATIALSTATAATAATASPPPLARADCPSLMPTPRPSSALCVATGVHLCGELAPRAISLFGHIAALDALVLVCPSRARPTRDPARVPSTPCPAPGTVLPGQAHRLWAKGRGQGAWRRPVRPEGRGASCAADGACRKLAVDARRVYAHQRWRRVRARREEFDPCCESASASNCGTVVSSL